MLDILTRIRNVVPQTFCVGIKLNSVDHSTADFEETMIQIKLLVDAGLDFMEISGGSYEEPRMVGYPVSTKAPKSERTVAREAFFFPRALDEVPNIKEIHFDWIEARLMCLSSPHQDVRLRRH